MLWTAISRQRVKVRSSVNIHLACDSKKIHSERRLQERTEDAKASGGEEGRGKLRKAPGNCKQVLIRRYPNGATRLAEGQSLT